MRRCLLLAGLGLVALGCDDGTPSRGDGGAGPLADGGVAADGAAEPPAVAVICPPPDADERVIVTLDGPGLWQLEDCPVDEVGLRFTLPPRTDFALEAISRAGADPPAYAHPPRGANDTDAPVEQVGWLFPNGEPTPVVALRWVECLGIDSCGAGRYCSPWLYACADCADGDELFDVGAAGAPRTDATPQAIAGRTMQGVACDGFDDWYVLNQPAGQAVSVASLQASLEHPPATPRMLHAYLADPDAPRLANLVPVPFEDGLGLRATGTDRTLWLRASTDWRAPQPDDEGGEPSPEAQQAYAFELGGCRTARDCLPWSDCDQDAAPAACVPCAGEQDAIGDDGTEAAPVRIEPGAPVEGTVCAADVDWYTLTVEDPAVRLVVTDGRGLFLQDNAGVGSEDQWTRVYRRGADGTPDEVVLRIEGADGTTDGRILPYTIQTTVLEACDFEVHPPACPAGSACLDGVCLDGAPMGDSCEVACGRGADCLAGEEVCPGLGAEDRAGLAAECLLRCAQVPVLARSLNRLETCAEIADLIRNIDTSFGDRCDGQQ